MKINYFNKKSEDNLNDSPFPDLEFDSDFDNSEFSFIDLANFPSINDLRIVDYFDDFKQKRKNLKHSPDLNVQFSRKAEILQLDGKIADLSDSLDNIQSILDLSWSNENVNSISQKIKLFIDSFRFKSIKDDLELLREVDRIEKTQSQLDFLLFIKEILLESKVKVTLIKVKLVKSLCKVFIIDLGNWIKKRLRLISNYNIDEDIILFTTQRDLISNKIILLHGNNRIFKTYRQAS